MIFSSLRVVLGAFSTAKLSPPSTRVRGNGEVSHAESDCDTPFTNFDCDYDYDYDCDCDCDFCSALCSA